MLAAPVRVDGSAVPRPRAEDHRESSSVLLAVWREACRHIEIGESTDNIARILAERMPIGQILVRHFDPKRPSLETVAVGAMGASSRAAPARTECTPAQLRQLQEWSSRGQLLHRRPGTPGPSTLDWIVPRGIEQDVLAGPLNDLQGPCGILVLVAQENQQFDARHLALVKELLEPFSTAIENDRHVREVATLRAAAEADKRSLLSRLGRKDVQDRVVGAQSGLRSILKRVELVARADAPVLILGETGTGKEVIARLIHSNSTRAAGPFLRINCGAIPPELIDSQLFGHERGAFTGAVETRQGWFERADGGTLLLDEIGELPPAAQVRLLRILQDGWLERVGGQQPVHVNVRIVAATHRDLAAMAAEGTFREDLWYRIAVFPLRLPPLRERIEDIPELARHFAERAAVRFNLALALPTPEDVQLLESYCWPGNIRELAAVIDRAAILGDGRRLEVAKSLGVAANGPGASQTDGGAVATAAVPPSSVREVLPLDAAMKLHIEAALKATHGQIEGRRGAGALLKVNPHTLRAKMRKLGVNWARFRDLQVS